MRCSVLRFLMVGAVVCGMIMLPRMSAAASATQWFVATEGNNDQDCQTTQTACQTITAAVEKARDGDAIQVAAGTYAEHLTLTKSLFIAGDPERPTILDGNNAGRVITITSALSATTRVSVTLSLLTIQRGNAGPAGGGGIANDNGSLVLQQSAVISNTATVGGGLYNALAGSVTLTNVTFSANVVPPAMGGSAAGGALYSAYGSTTTLTNVTMSHNTAFRGGGLYWQGPPGPTCHPPQCSVSRLGGFTLHNVLLAHNTGGNCAAQFEVSLADVTSLGGNVSDDAACQLALSTAEDHNATDPMLGSLHDNGGPTRTYALPPTSPAIDVGTAPACPAIDQRGLPRPRDGTGTGQARCDSGAYEVQAVQTYTLYAPLISRSSPV